MKRRGVVVEVLLRQAAVAVCLDESFYVAVLQMECSGRYDQPGRLIVSAHRQGDCICSLCCLCTGAGFPCWYPLGRVAVV